MESLKLLGWLVKKDVLTELRSKELLFGLLFLSCVLVLSFAFAFLGAERPSLDVVVGVLWTTVLIGGTLGVGRVFERERENDTLRALLLSPLPRPALYAAKLISIALLMFTLIVAVLLVTLLLFSVNLGGGALALTAALALGTIGYAAVAAMFGAALGKANARDVLLFLIVYPLVVPLVIAGTRASAAALRGENPSFWLKFLFTFDLIFVVLGLWIFEPVAGGDA